MVSRRLGALAGALVAAGTLVGAALPAQAVESSALPTVQFWVHANFDGSGGGWGTGAGFGQCVQLDDFYKNKFSSLKTSNTVILFDGDGCSLGSATFTQEAGGFGWMNDRANSFKII
ncbi:hypothetical protein L3Q67_14690 [Saccharothrix sp. AJ9571]|nr:hypothetical protein L3Q67_14690 [Saccharothrix sp. AJ9571]